VNLVVVCFDVVMVGWVEVEVLDLLVFGLGLGYLVDFGYVELVCVFVGCLLIFGVCFGY